MKPEPMTDAAIRELALKLVEGRVYGTWSVPSDLWRLVFMPLAFVDTKTWRRWKKERVAHVYAIFGEDGATRGRAINGYPFFGECRIITEPEFLKLKIAANMARKMRERFVNGRL